MNQRKLCRCLNHDRIQKKNQHTEKSVEMLNQAERLLEEMQILHISSEREEKGFLYLTLVWKQA